MIKLESAYLKLVKGILASHVPQYEVRAFGSRVHGEKLKPFSDLDLVIMTEKSLSTLKMAELKEAFSESDLPIKVDVVDWSEVSENFRSQINASFETLQKKSSM